LDVAAAVDKKSVGAVADALAHAMTEDDIEMIGADLVPGDEEISGKVHVVHVVPIVDTVRSIAALRPTRRAAAPGHVVVAASVPVGATIVIEQAGELQFPPTVCSRCGVEGHADARSGKCAHRKSAQKKKK
jgi:hypothetical protein